MPDYKECIKRVMELQKCLEEEGRDEYIKADSLELLWGLIEKCPHINWVITLTPDNYVYVSAVLKGGDV
jgi:hypothetical protein